jgi:hypothetical protein
MASHEKPQIAPPDCFFVKQLQGGRNREQALLKAA